MRGEGVRGCPRRCQGDQVSGRLGGEEEGGGEGTCLNPAKACVCMAMSALRVRAAPARDPLLLAAVPSEGRPPLPHRLAEHVPSPLLTPPPPPQVVVLYDLLEPEPILSNEIKVRGTGGGGEMLSVAKAPRRHISLSNEIKVRGDDSVASQCRRARRRAGGGERGGGGRGAGACEMLSVVKAPCVLTPPPSPPRPRVSSPPYRATPCATF